MPAPAPDRIVELGENVARRYSGLELCILENDMMTTVSPQECSQRMRSEGKRVIMTKAPLDMIRGPFAIEVDYIDDRDLLIHSMTLWGDLRVAPQFS